MPRIILGTTYDEYASCPFAYEHPYQESPCEGCGFDGFEYVPDPVAERELAAQIAWLNSLCSCR